MILARGRVREARAVALLAMEGRRRAPVERFGAGKNGLLSYFVDPCPYATDRYMRAWEPDELRLRSAPSTRQ